MSVGILVVGAIPSTLASAAVWTRRAGGNDAVAILGTIVTNLSCFVVTPVWLFQMTGETVRTSSTLAEMIVKLDPLKRVPSSLCGPLDAPADEDQLPSRETVG